MGNTDSKLSQSEEGTPVRRRRSSTLTFKSSRSAKSSLKEPSEWEQAQMTLSSNTLLLHAQPFEKNGKEFCNLKLSNAECYTTLKMPGKAFIEVADIFSAFLSYLQSDEHSLDHEWHICCLKKAASSIPVCDAFTQSRTCAMQDALDRLAKKRPTIFSDEVSLLTMSFAELYNYYGFKNESLAVYKSLIERYMLAMQETEDDAHRRIYAEKALNLSKKISVAT